MICPKCGNEIDNVAKFCPRCGAQINFDTEGSTGLNQSVTLIPLEKEPDSPLKSKIVARNKKPIILGIMITALVIAVLVCIFNYFTTPWRVRETGECTLTLHDSVTLESIGSTIEFTDFWVDQPNYDDLTTTIHFKIKVFIPRGSQINTYEKWLTSFWVNDVSASHSITEKSDTGEKYVLYDVSYLSTFRDKSYALQCKINKNLTINFNYDKSFWELDGINKETAIAVGQRKIDSEYGITYVDWDNKNNQPSYSEGNLYRITGKVEACDLYMWGTTNEYYIMMSGAYFYFDKDEWEKMLQM